VKTLPVGSVIAACLVTACERPAARGERPDATVPALTPDAARSTEVPAPPRGFSPDVAVVEGQPCAEDRDCPSGRCFNEGLEAQYSRTLRDCPDARAWRDGRRLGTCVVDDCARDSDCPAGQRCATPQMLPFPQRVCLPASCRGAGVCAGFGRVGQCFPYLAGRPCEHGGWACSFPDDACSPVEVGRRCRPVGGHIAYCIPVRGRFRCVRESP
jgi:hypothetical protein